MNDPRPVCRACGTPVQPGGSGIVAAVEVVHGQDYGGEPADVVEEGERVFFHDHHAPTTSGHYRIVG